ncbi:MAG: aminotransferase class I/II-fold pyridoxal phosphate-dependent enzyme [Bryobacterales bacterium]|nr:aminotransferase class I/II-fold pyridoxal phosphate-dependent enzyme [Bryobacterales bacterium]MEB2363344.1 aminotransferase class I/II-fold pyridoxal phosphate-dependent enzyme [Bryobacterales bacterium]
MTANRHLQLDSEEMRAIGYRIIDLIVERHRTLPDQPATHKESPPELSRRLHEPLPECGCSMDAILQQVLDDVFSNCSRLDHPRFFGFVPSPSNFIGAMADALASGFNIFAGSWISGAGAAALELVTIDWMRQLCGMPESAGGIFVSGGSMANLTGLALARHAMLDDRTGGAVAYLSDQTHASVRRALRVLGFLPCQISELATDGRFRLRVEDLAAAAARDRSAGKRPFCVIANAGTTNTGAVDPLAELSRFCRDENLWLHVDGAYGAAAVLCERGRALLEGLESADSLSLDPHKWLFQPFESGCVLVRQGALLAGTFRVLPEYLADIHRGAEDVNFGDRGIQLTRGFRALKLWMTIKYFGLEAMRKAVVRGFELAEAAEAEIRKTHDFEIVTPAQMGVVTFRHSRAADQEFYRRLVDGMAAGGLAFLTSTVLRGETVLRLCTINPRTCEADLTQTLDRLRELAAGMIGSG